MLYMFDIDGTLIVPFYKGKEKRTTDTPTEDYDYGRVEVMENRLELVRLIVSSDAHACFALITNQGGVAFGYQTVEQAETKLAKVCQAMKFFYNKPFSVHVCYTHPEATQRLYLAKDYRRKPNCGMLDEAMQAHRLVDRTNAMYVGDLETDAQAAVAAGVMYMTAEDFFRHGTLEGR